jgi:hypothetical protein
MIAHSTTSRAPFSSGGTPAPGTLRVHTTSDPPRLRATCHADVGRMPRPQALHSTHCDISPAMRTLEGSRGRRR